MHLPAYQGKNCDRLGFYHHVRRVDSPHIIVLQSRATSKMRNLLKTSLANSQKKKKNDSQSITTLSHNCSAEKLLQSASFTQLSTIVRGLKYSQFTMSAELVQSQASQTASTSEESGGSHTDTYEKTLLNLKTMCIKPKRSSTRNQPATDTKRKQTIESDKADTVKTKS